MKKALINLTCLITGILIGIYLFKIESNRQTDQYDKCMSKLTPSVESECHCVQKWPLAKVQPRFAK
jgi:uncharacterized protein YxeA